MREMIRLENLSKSFAGLEVIKNISFTLSEGEVLSIIGPSGSGKYTMLRIITQPKRQDVIRFKQYRKRDYPHQVK